MAKKRGPKPVTGLARQVLDLLQDELRTVVGLTLPVPPECRWFHLTPGAASILQKKLGVSHKPNVYKAFLNLEKRGIIQSRDKGHNKGKLYRLIALP